MRRRLRTTWRGRIVIVGGVTVAVVLAIAFASTRGGAAAVPNRIVVADTACAPGWIPPHSGRTVFTVVNTSTVTSYEVAFAGADHVSDYGQIERLAPGTSDTMDVVVPPGAYTFECAARGGGILDSAPGFVTGPPVHGATTFQPVTPADMYQATLAYHESLLPWLRRLGANADALVHSRTRADARRDWLAAHLDYARLGAAYDAFGDYGARVEQDFAAAERALWRGGASRPAALALDRDVHALVRAFPKLTIANGDVALRTHEILENTLQFELTGQTDNGSGTNLATAWANVQGTKLSLAAISQLLTASSPSLLATARAGLSRLGALLVAYRRPDGSWRTLASLSRVERARLDAATSGLLEQLAPIPDRLEMIPNRSTNGHDAS